MEISIITSLFNRLDLTRAYLESLERALGRWRYEVILVDDGSTDGTREFLATLPANRFRVVLNDVPRGFAANNNAAARLARAPLLCLLNNDVVLLPGWLEPMARLARWDARVACVGNVQREPVSGQIDHAGIHFRHGDGHPLHVGKNLARPPEETYVCWPAVTAACCVIRKRVFEQLGGFDEAFRNGYEDTDFCLRARAQGYRHFVVNHSVIYHYISASPNRRLHEDANYARFLERWGHKAPSDHPNLHQLSEQHREGRRYLLKHLRRPWRYNGGRLWRALSLWLRPWPLGSRLDWKLRAWFRLLDFFQGLSLSSLPDAGSAASVFLVVDDTVQNAARSGIQTVVRQLAAALGRMRAPVRTVVWDNPAESLQLLPSNLSAGLDAETLRDPTAPPLPLHKLSGSHRPATGSWVLIPELMHRPYSARLVEYAHRHGWKVALIFYDAIPVTHPQFVPPSLPARHEGYMRDFSHADLILPISEASAQDWRNFVTAHGLPPSPVRACLLASDMPHVSRVRPEEIPPLADAHSRPIKMLCISTVEPRKNHHALLAAYELATTARPDLRLELNLVGAPYENADDLAEEVRAFVARHPGRVAWHEQVEYSLLRRLYEEADFTVYPSVLEGFGLPLIESLWFGRPCICADFGVMAENAAGGGCLAVDVRDPQTLADAFLALAGSPELRRTLALAATTRRLKTWDEYAAEVLSCLNVAA